MDRREWREPSGWGGTKLSEIVRPALERRRILIVEDRFLVADDLSRFCRRHGGEIAGPVPDVERAGRMASEERLDLAILDVDLQGRDVFGVAAILERRGIPFVFVTGYGQSHLPERFRERPLSPKPYSEADLLAQIQSLLKPLPGQGPSGA